MSRQPWWKYGTPTIENEFYGAIWARTALVLRALESGVDGDWPTVNQNFLRGVLREDRRSFLESIPRAFPELHLLVREEDDGLARYERAIFYSTDSLIDVAFEDALALVTFVGFEKTAVAFKSWFNSHTGREEQKGRVYALMAGENGPRFKALGLVDSPLERGNYEPEVLSGFDRIVADLQAARPAGRISILDGAPGTGKTYLVRALLSEVQDVTFVVVPANLIEQLAQPSLLPALIDLHRSEHRPIVFIVEDADEILAPRDGANMSAVSALLNLGDGILGQLLDIRIVTTTNAHRQNLDEAIIRPGRLSAMVHVGPLSPEFAGAVYQRLTGKPPYLTSKSPYAFELDKVLGPLFPRGATLAEVYQVAHNSGWVGPKEMPKIGF